MAKGKRTKAGVPPSSTPAQAHAASAATITPSWPKFKPPLPVADLVPETIVPDKVVVFRSFFPRSLCRDYISFLSALPLTTTPGKPKRGEALRVNDRYQVDDSAFALRLFTETGLKDALCDPAVAHLWCVSLSAYKQAIGVRRANERGVCPNRGGEVVGLNPNIRVYRYKKGQFFDAHCMLLALSTLPKQYPHRSPLLPIPFPITCSHLMRPSGSKAAVWLFPPSPLLLLSCSSTWSLCRVDAGLRLASCSLLVGARDPGHSSMAPDPAQRQVSAFPSPNSRDLRYQPHAQ